MAEPAFLDPYPSNAPLFDFDFSLDGLPLPADFDADFPFDDFDISTDFPIEDLLRSPEDQSFPLSNDGSPAPNSNDGSPAPNSNDGSPAPNSNDESPAPNSNDESPATNSNDGSGTSSSNPHQSSDLSRNSAPSSPDSGNFSGVTSHEVKLEEEKTRWNLKRKKDREDGCANPNPRSSKYRLSEEGNSVGVFNAGSEEEEKRNARLMRNRESAQLSRMRKKHYVEELEQKVKSMHSTINELNSKISYIMAENASLRQQLGGSGGNCPPPGVYPHPPMVPMQFPWIRGYGLRPQGSKVPLVPIPKLKPQQPTSAPRAKKSESRKNESKTRKVASVSLLGLLLVMLFFGSIVPGINLGHGGRRDEVSGRLAVMKGGIFGQSKGRILSFSGHGSGLNGTDEIGLRNGEKGFGEGVDRCTGRRRETGVDGSVFKVKLNSSETLPALLYVPRNGKHVKINGNLIIHSVLASEKAMANNVASALALPKSGREVDRRSNSYRSSAEHQRALSSDYEDAFSGNSKTIPVDGPLQQWFREGMAGPILSSGMCTEVFQFDVSPASAPGGIIPATKIVNTSVANATGKLPPAHPRKMKNRRIMYPEPIPLTGTPLNDSQHFGEPSESSNFGDDKSVTSMVVSVLADPREAIDGDGDATISPKSLSRIFVVVLLDSVKYVTYSCVLPFKSSSPHLVN